MPLNYKVYLKDILNSINEIINYTEDIKNYKKYISDTKTMRAVERNLEIIGEAVKKIPENIKNEHSDIDWRKISGLRDVLIHGYSDIDNEIIWEVISEKIPNLKKYIEKNFSFK
ncbi:MAG: DUF86 domain-containing protein [Spirochaetia bacterium]|nr:DUF86 domain-containing protein [Spirochaetia bacterium]